MTPNSADAAFCTGAQFTIIFDWRTAAELLSDLDTALTTKTLVENSTILEDFLKQGAGQIEMACSIGNRYKVYTDDTPSDLEQLAATTKVMASRLHRLNAVITMEYLWRRRPDKAMPNMKEFDEAQEMLKALASGELIFGFVETMNAGLLDSDVETPAIVEARNLPSYIAQNIFGRRSNRIAR